jgi:hypothetical protein
VQGTIIAVFFLGTTIIGLEFVGTEPWTTDVFSGVAHLGKRSQLLELEPKARRSDLI